MLRDTGGGENIFENNLLHSCRSIGAAMITMAFVSRIRLATARIAVSPRLRQVRIAGAFQASSDWGFVRGRRTLGKNVELADIAWQRLLDDVLNIVLVVTTQPCILRCSRCAIIDRRGHVKVRTKSPYPALPACQASAGPATFGQGHEPLSGGRATRASLYRVASVRPHGDKRVTMLGIFIAPWGHSYPQPPFPAEAPFDAASSIAHCASDVLADALVEHGLPRHELESDAVIDHGEAAAGELGGADKRAADIFAGLGGGERQTAFGSHGLADTSHLRTLQIGDKIL
jgi:hypothetical protein